MGPRIRNRKLDQLRPLSGRWRLLTRRKDINFTKDSSISLHAIHSPICWQILKKTILFSDAKNPYKKICETRKVKPIHEQHEAKRVENQTKTRV